MNPHSNGRVLSVDEKTQIQALDRKPFQWTKDAKTIVKAVVRAKKVLPIKRMSH